MNKFYFNALLLLVIAFFSFSSCTKDGNETIVLEENNGKGSLKDDYFTIAGATYNTGSVPAATTSQTITGLTYNSRALQGGMNFITITSTVQYSKFYISVKGVNGYWTYVPVTQPSLSNGYYTYTIPISYTTNFGDDIVMLISGVDGNNNVTTPYEAEVTYVDSQSGDLNINLTFDNAKDIDLHLELPSGEIIYYGNRGGSYTLPDGTSVTYGLDHDSNAGCTIDNLNNENIYIPKELITAGTYKVYVNMFSNCNTSIATQWSVVARYQGAIIQNELGANPISGTYPVGAPNGDMTEAIRFTLTNTQTSRRANSMIFDIKRIEPTDMDLMKMEEASWNANR